MKKLLVFLISLAICEMTIAQNCCDKWYLDANYTYLEPLKDFKAGGFQRGHGASLGVYYDLNPNAQKIVFHPGLRFNVIFGKIAKDNITLADPANAPARTMVYNAIIDAQLLGRVIFQPHAVLSPYLDGFGGLRVSAGHEKISLVDSYPGYDEDNSNQVISRGNWNWGGSIGGLIRLHPNVDFDIRLSVDYSPELEYIDMDSYQKVEDNLVYDFSKTNALDYTFHIGFRFKLGCGRDDSSRRYNDRRNSPPRRNKKGRTPTKKTPSSKSPKS